MHAEEVKQLKDMAGNLLDAPNGYYNWEEDNTGKKWPPEQA